MNNLESACLLVGRFLLGIYFILPDIGKITNFAGTSAYMAEHHVPMIPVLLVITIIVQLAAGSAIILGYRGKLSAFLLAGLTLIISVFMHNFWDMEEGLARAHETQNFFKNMGIMAGLLVVAGLGTGQFSLDRRLGQKSHVGDADPHSAAA